MKKEAALKTKPDTRDGRGMVRFGTVKKKIMPVKKRSRGSLLALPTGATIHGMKLHAFLISAPEGGYVSFNPETGTTTQGETVEEAIANLKEAVELYFEECPPSEVELEGADRPAMLATFEAELA